MRISDWSSDVCSSDLMVNNSLHALNELQSAISSGGILGILSAGFNAFGSVSQTGLLGKGLQGTFKDFSGLPGFATGGSFRVGGAPGIDKNLVAFRATRGEMVDIRSDEHTSELQSLMRISYAVFCLKKKHKYITRNLVTTI